MAELDYLAALEETYKKRKWRLSQKAEREVINLYGKALQDLATELEKTGGLKGRFIKGRMHSLYQDLYKLQKDSITAAAYMSNAFNEDIMNRIGTSAKMNHAFGQLFKSIPLETILAMEKGKLYKDGLGLSKRLWLYVEGNGTQIEHILKQGFIQGTSAKDLAGILAEHVNPACRKIWPRERVKELLGPGYSSANKPLEYNAMRLARTSISHAYSLNNRLASAKNPFIDGFIWHSAFAHGRTCEICKERDGQHFTAKDMPYDHPNGLCWEEPYLPKSLDEYGKEIGDWIDGKENKRLDSWWAKNKSKYGDLKDLVSRREQAKKSERDFSHMKEVFRKAGAEEHWRDIERMIDESPEFIKDLYAKNQTKLKIDTVRQREGAFYNPRSKGISFNIKSDKKNSRGAYSTFFHEFGHLLDEQVPGGNSKLSETKEFFKALSNDYLAAIEGGEMKNKPVVEVIKTIVDKQRKQGDLGSGVQDIFSGFSLNQIRAGWGHSTDYWKRGDTKLEIASEAFAHMSSGYTNPGRLKLMKEWFPTACEVFEEIIQKVLK